MYEAFVCMRRILTSEISQFREYIHGSPVIARFNAKHGLSLEGISKIEKNFPVSGATPHALLAQSLVSDDNIFIPLTKDPTTLILAIICYCSDTCQRRKITAANRRIILHCNNIEVLSALQA